MLNAAQHQAVEHDQGPLLVLAGAGSGKTRVITHRIARLLERGTLPQQILAVSFTNKAAAELRERMVPLVGAKTAEKLWLSTFHSFGVRFLGEEGKTLGHKGRFVIFDQSDCVGLVRQLLKGQHDRSLDIRAIHSRLSLWKNQSLAPEQVPENDFEYDAVAREVYPEYESSLRSMRAYDFDDLVTVPARLMQVNAEVRTRWQARFRYLMIDEFQDTNRVQLELIRQLTNELGNICVVGDDDQSIYGWRGADVENILGFEHHFPGTQVVTLDLNYRSQQPILDVANAAISRSRRRARPKVLKAFRPGLSKVRVCVLDDAAEEALMVAREVSDLIKEGHPPDNIAILYRSNLQARLIEEELRGAAVPYRLYGGTQFFDRKEVKDSAAYLRVLINPRDELSYRRVLNYPARGIGATTFKSLEHYMALNRCSFDTAVDALATGTMTSSTSAQQGASHLVDVFRQARAKLGTTPLAETAETLLIQAGIRAELTSGTSENEKKMGDRRWENVRHLLRSIDRFEKSEASRKPSLGQFLQRITMRLEQGETGPVGRATLSTLHASKGLEFPIVFLIGCVEGQLPHTRTTDPKVTDAIVTDVDEERRLFYVGVTRAKDRLYITRPRARSMRGRTTPLTPSRFLDDLPQTAIEHYERPDKKPLSPADAAHEALDILKQLQSQVG